MLDHANGQAADEIDERDDDAGLRLPGDEPAGAVHAGEEVGLPLQIDGRRRVIQVDFEPEYNETGGSRAYSGVLQDVTERRRSDVELATAIEEALKDATWLSRSILDKLATLRRPAPHAASVELSPREREILELVCDDLDDAAIGERLTISRNTVRNHVASIYAKIGTNRRSGAVVWGRERGMGSKRD